jgi:uncharacterized protein (TIGR02300 family)
MTAKDLGRKHSCWKCGTKFYDLKKSAPICPKCGADPRESPSLKPAAQEKKVRPAPKVEPAEEVDLGEEEGDKELEEGFEEEIEEADDEA